MAVGPRTRGVRAVELLTPRPNGRAAKKNVVENIDVEFWRATRRNVGGQDAGRQAHGLAEAVEQSARARPTQKQRQIVLVFQGGGALGAYQAGVYQALHEASIEPDWIIGTSIGAINASLIAGNEPENRLDRLEEFWRRMRRKEL